MSPAFTVVVPTVGRPRHLRGCLSALARLERPDGGFEVVVVNDGGGETVARAVAASPGIEARVVTPSGTGPSAARNAGANAGAGRYLAFTDDDCEPRPSWLRELGRALESYPGAGAGGVTVNGARSDPGAVASQLVVDALHDHFNRERPRFFASQNVALPAEDFREVGGFHRGFRYGEDRELCERWLASGRRLVAAPDAVVEHMRTLTPAELWRQHHGYGRGAWAFARAGSGAADTPGVIGAILRRALRERPATGRLRLAGYLALSQLATASGFAREAIADAPVRARRRRAVRPGSSP